MTANYKLDAILEIRKFLWSKLVAAEIFDENEYFSDSINDKIGLFQSNRYLKWINF